MHNVRLPLMRRPRRPLMENSLDEGERRSTSWCQVAGIFLRLGETCFHHRHGLDEPDREQWVASGEAVTHPGYDEIQLVEGRSCVHRS